MAECFLGGTTKRKCATGQYKATENIHIDEVSFNIGFTPKIFYIYRLAKPYYYTNFNALFYALLFNDGTNRQVVGSTYQRGEESGYAYDQFNRYVDIVIENGVLSFVRIASSFGLTWPYFTDETEALYFWYASE